MVFSIKLTECDVWVGKRNISYFITDDSAFTFMSKTQKDISIFGVPQKRRRLFSSTDEIRRSLRSINKESISQIVNLPYGIQYEILTRGNSLGKFSNFVVVDLTNDKTYPLDDVISGLI
jgi:hypothetical protein